MRTTLDIRDRHHEALSTLARRRGLRGLSEIVDEALEIYLASLAADEVDALLSLEGVLSAADADVVRSTVEEVRAAWPEAL